MKKFSTILFVLVWFSVSIFGEGNSSTKVANEEIGYPIIDNEAGSIESATLAPNRKNFYTLKGGKITYWQMNPIKPIDSLQLDVNTTTENRLQRYNIYSSQDGKRVILHSYTQIQLWDLQSKKLLKTIDEPSRLATTYKNNFITVSRDNHLKIWDDKSLKLLRDKNWGERQFCNDYGDCYRKDLMNIFAGKELLYLLYSYNTDFFVDFNTLKIIDTSCKEIDQQDKNKYYAKYASLFFPTLSKENLGHSHYFISTSIHNEKNELLTDVMQIVKLGRNSDTILQWIYPQKIGKRKINKYKIYKFNDAWFLYIRRSRYFASSKNAKKYLKMKTKDGKVIPMNDATFQKYNKTISIGEKR